MHAFSADLNGHVIEKRGEIEERNSAEKEGRGEECRGTNESSNGTEKETEWRGAMEGDEGKDRRKMEK